MGTPKGPSQSEYTELLTLAAHELRTPVSVVIGYLRMLRDGTTDEGQRRMFDEAERSSSRVAELAEQLSLIAKLDTGTAKLAAEQLDLFAIVGDAVAAVRTRPDSAATLTMRGESSGGALVGDRGRIRAALTAIVAAVVRQQPSSATVVVDCAKTLHQEAIIVVALDGDVGRARNTPIEPFDERRGGLGLALPLARRVIEHHGGRVGSPDLGDRTRPIVVSFPLP